MYRILFIIHYLLFLVLGALSAQESPLPDHTRLRDRRQLLEILDQTLEHRQQYIDVRQQEIDLLKVRLTEARTDLERWSLYSALYNRYGSYRTDSAFVYAKKAHELAMLLGSESEKQHSSIDLAYCYSLSGLYHQGEELMPARSEVLPDVLLNYYIAQCSFLLWQSEFTTIPELKASLLARSMAYHDSILLTDPNPLHQMQERVQIPGLMPREEAIALLENAIDSLPASEDYIRYMALMTGNFFLEQQQRDSALIFYTISAISDMQHGILEHASLQRVAALLFEEGDVEHAYHYMDCCLKDAKVCGARLRALELQENLDIIMSAYNNQLLSNHQQLQAVLIAVVALLVVVVLVSIRLNQLRRRIKLSSEQLLKTHQDLQQSHTQLEQAMDQVRVANSRLEQVNASLHESNHLKDSLMAQYMKQCREGIGNFQAYQQRLLRLVMTHSADLLEETIRNAETLEPAIENFCQNFDETFLLLYPDFVSELNTRLRLEEQYPVTPHLTAELRVFALMRLGITDLDEIAAFLGCASKTVLNYRSRLRQKAIVDKEELDRWICKPEGDYVKHVASDTKNVVTENTDNS